MAQHDYVIANANGATVRADINNALLAISSTNSGSSEPSTPYAYEMWVDTSNNLLKLRNAANDGWITLGVSITASNTVDINGGAIDGTPIGASSASTGAFSTLSTTDNLSIGGSNKELRFYEGSNYVGFEAPALSADQIWVLPSADGSADQYLKTDGSGNLSFSTVSSTTINNNADNRVITGSGTANTLNAETTLTWDGSTFTADGGAVFNDSSADVDFRVESDGNTHMLFVDGGNDRVGIGSASPSTALEVSGAVTVTRSDVANDNSSISNEGGLFVISAATGGGGGTYPMLFKTDNLERMRIDSSGNVLVGETSADAKFHAKTTGYPVAKFERDGGSTGSQGWTQVGHSVIGYSGGTGADSYIISQHGFGFRVNDDNTLLTLTDSDKVGIGTTDPDSILHLKDPSSDTIITMEGGAADANCRINFQNSSGTFRGFLSYDTDDNNLQFNVNNSEAIRLDSSQNVLIGTTTGSPQSKLNVLDSAAQFTAHIMNSHATTPYGVKVEYTGGSPNSASNYWFIYCEDTTEAKAKLRSNGYFYLAGTAYGSDRELKENIVDTPDSLAKLKEIRVRDFNLKGQEELHTGVIAQEIESIFPDLLGEEVISKQDAEVEKKIKTVEYNGLIGILVKSVQELTEKVEALESA